MFIITQEGSTSRCQSYLPGKLEFIQMFIFSGIEFFEEIKEALVEKMCFQIFGVLVQVSSSEHRYDTVLC